MNQFQYVAPDPEKHLRAIGQLTAEVFSGGKYVDAYCDNYIGNSHYDWNVSRLAFDGEKLIHHWGVWGYQMRLETAQLKVGGIGAVATHPDYRKQGVLHHAAQESFEAMKQSGYDLSILRGRHYAKMGYARAWNYVHFRFKLDDFQVTEAIPGYQSLGLEHVPAMDALYNQTMPLSVARPSAPPITTNIPKICAHMPGAMQMATWLAMSAQRHLKKSRKPYSASKRPAIQSNAWLCLATCSSAAVMKISPVSPCHTSTHSCNTCGKGIALPKTATSTSPAGACVLLTCTVRCKN